MRHGHRGNSDAPVWISLAAGEDRRVTITYEDTAPPFNPYAHVAGYHAGDRQARGRGVLLLQRLAASGDYAYLYGRNRIRLARIREAGARGRTPTARPRGEGTSGLYRPLMSA